jgi:hypothetical protein
LPQRLLLDALYGRALQSPHPSCADYASGIARRLLFVRAHWLRMPPRLLARHLAHKAFAPAREDK